MTAHDAEQPGPRDCSAGDSRGTRSALPGTCYFPGWATRTIEFIDGAADMVAEVTEFIASYET